MTTHLIRPPASLAADPGRQAFLMLRTAFTVAPVAFGLDFYDVALRDLGLLVAAVALARLAVRCAPGRGSGTRS